MNLQGVPSQTVFVEEGKDYFLDDNEELPYTLVKNLGHGHSANVEMIQDQFTGLCYARKVFRINGNKNERRRIFSNEIKVIRRLARHHHIVRVFATYMSRKETGLILSPVASQGDLESYLQDFREGRCTESSMHTLISAFGCLASGLLFMHTQHVRHKDIKPRNILIHNNCVIYTDFGYSLDHSTATGSTTTGRPHTLTRKYCAPEVQEWEPRNAKSDIFSLGCVFYEIFASLGFCDMPETPDPYHDRIEEVRNLVQGGLGPVNEWFRPIGDLTCAMLDSLPEQRPTAKNIAKELWCQYRGHFCPQCRQSLPAESIVDFPPQPLHEYASLMRTNFLTGWMASEDMISGSMLLDQINTHYPEGYIRDEIRSPVQHYVGDNRSPILTRTPSIPSTKPEISHSLVFTDSNRRDVTGKPKSPSPDIIPTGVTHVPSTLSSPPQRQIIANGTRPVCYPATPDFALLRRSSTVIHDKQIVPRTSASPTLKMENTVVSSVPEISSPQLIKATAVASAESPKTYAMALAGDRDKTPIGNPQRQCPCRDVNCKAEFQSVTEWGKHISNATLGMACSVANCEFQDRRFSLEELQRHMYTAHGPPGGITWIHYQCVVPNCLHKNRIWTRIKDFKKHVNTMHHSEDTDTLIKKSTIYPYRNVNRGKFSGNINAV